MMFQPDNAAAAAAWIKKRAASKAPFYIRGGGTRLPLPAYLPEDCLSAANMDKLRFFDPEDMVIGVEAGMPVRRLQEILAAENMCLPVRPWFPNATVGGMIGADDFGPERMMGGGLRDFIIGVEYVNGHGELVKAGGRVVKNVTGYDLCRMMIGSMGGLGLVCALNFRVLPMPANPKKLEWECGEDWTGNVKKLLISGLPINSIEVEYQSGKWRLSLVVSGNRACLTRVISDCKALLGEWLKESDARKTLFDPVFPRFPVAEQPYWHIFGRFPTAALNHIKKLERLAALGVGLIIHPAGAAFHLISTNQDPELPRRIHRIFQESEGHLLVWNNGLEYKGPGIIPAPSGWKIVERLQNVLDPSSIFCPRLGALIREN